MVRLPSDISLKDTISLLEAFEKYRDPVLWDDYQVSKKEYDSAPRFEIGVITHRKLLSRLKRAWSVLLDDFFGRFGEDGDLNVWGRPDRVDASYVSVPGDAFKYVSRNWDDISKDKLLAKRDMGLDAQVFFSVRVMERSLIPQDQRQAESKAIEWLRDEITQLMKKEKPINKTKNAFRDEAMLEFKSLSRRGFDRVWARISIEFPEISRAGRKPKS